MNQTIANDATSDLGNTPRAVNISNANDPAETRDANFPDLRPEPVASAAQSGDPGANAGLSGNPDARVPLFGDSELQDFRSNWNQAQSTFVDDPRQAVQTADGLVGRVVQRLSDQFASQRNMMEQQWSRGDNVSTEDLRLALRRYRSFFDRLLNI